MTAQDTPATLLSCEFFPPRTEAGMDKLVAVKQQLADQIQPVYFSVTFGAGGSTRDSTLETVRTLSTDGSIITPHISCIGSTREQLYELLKNYQQMGIKQLVTLRGDIPADGDDSGDFHYASELVRFIRDTTGDHFHLEVAAYPEYHPESTSPQSDFAYFREKVEAGANGAITQYFYNIDAFDHFMEQCEQANLTIPITPGIMPITNYDRLMRFSDMCGAEVPRWISKQLQAYADDEASLQAFGNEVVSRLCQQLIERKVAGLHFYTLNQAQATLSICQNLTR